MLGARLARGMRPPATRFALFRRRFRARLRVEQTFRKGSRVSDGPRIRIHPGSDEATVVENPQLPTDLRRVERAEILCELRKQISHPSPLIGGHLLGRSRSAWALRTSGHERAAAKVGLRRGLGHEIEDAQDAV